MQNILDKFIDNMMGSLTCSAHVKDIKSGKYLCSNLINAKKFGFSKSEALIGATIFDLNDFMLPYWGREIVPNAIKQEHEIVYTEKPTVDRNRAFLTKDGFICVHYMTKIPVHNMHGIVSSIFTISENATHKLSLIDLWDTYKGYYVLNKSLAIPKYLNHVGIGHFFHEPPTEAEIKVLIARTMANSYKAVASLLHISVKTVESHLNSLKKKSKYADITTIASSMKIRDPHAEYM